MISTFVLLASLLFLLLLRIFEAEEIIGNSATAYWKKCQNYIQMKKSFEEVFSSGNTIYS